MPETWTLTVDAVGPERLGVHITRALVVLAVQLALASPTRCTTYEEKTMGRLQTLCADGTRGMSTWNKTLERWDITLTQSPKNTWTKEPSMPASILIVEDYSAHLELVRYLLEHDGHEPVTATTGEHAMEVLARVTPDLMLCDLHLGRGMDGYTFAEWARTQPRLAGCPMLCMTAYFEDFDADRARRCGFLTVIPKPISADTFVVQIEYYLPAEKRMVLRPLQP